MKNSKKIAFFGTPPFTLQFLDALYDEGFVPSLIVTNPNRPAGRGMAITAPEPKIWGDRHGIKVLQPEKIDSAFIETLSQEHWDLFIVIAYGAILPEPLITLPRFGTINVHYSLLPAYRGATPVEAAILNGDQSTGVSIQQMRFKLDSGPILAQKEIPIDPTDTTLTLREKLNNEALVLLPAVIQSLFDGIALPREQDEAQATFCRKIKKEDGAISLSDDPKVNDRKFRAYGHSPGVFFITERRSTPIRVKVKRAHFEEGRFILASVIPENGKMMSGKEFDRWITS